MYVNDLLLVDLVEIPRGSVGISKEVIQQNRFRNAFRMLLAYMMLLAAVIPPPNLNIILPIM